ncbi:MAG: ankyrin repeat domain-containing protein, partial [Erysipelotrichaceae bacterium]|nr:ankyrin repeat domain-containing protein [Erysipelotrichaceae bacterium]
MDQLEKKFLDASTVGDINKITACLKEGVDVNVRNDEGRTALMRCTRRGRIQVTQLLLDAGADVNAADEDNKTALMGAAKKGYVDVCQMLL